MRIYPVRRHEMCLAFCDYASQKGYIPMVYANKGMLENNLNASAISESIRFGWPLYISDRI